MTILRGLALGLIVVLLLQLFGVANFGLVFGTQSLVIHPGTSRSFEEAKSLTIGVFYDEAQHPGFVQGARRAADEINARGGITGLPLVLAEVDEADLTWREQDRNLQARSVVDGPETMAAIGHSDLSSLTRARAYFNGAQILHINATIPDSVIGQPEMLFSLATIPSVEDLADRTIAAAQAAGFGSVAILSDRGRAGLETRLSLRDAAAKAGLSVVVNRSQAQGDLGFFAEWRAVEQSGAEATLLALSGDTLQTALTDARLIGITHPIYVVHPDMLGRAASDAWPRALDIRLPVLDILSAGPTGTVWMQQAYEAVMLIADTAELLGEATPERLARALRQGVTPAESATQIRFDTEGRLANPRLTVRAIQ